MFGFLKSRVFLVIVGFVLLALFIWFAGPFFAFAEWRPLESEMARLVTLAVVIGLWIGAQLLRRWRARNKSAALLTAVARQPDAGGALSPDGQQMRERF